MSSIIGSPISRPVTLPVVQLAQSSGPSVVQPPSNEIAPIISGVFMVGYTVTATPGQWVNADSVSGEWYINNSLADSKGLTFDIQPEHNGASIYYYETAINAVGSKGQRSGTRIISLE